MLGRTASKAWKFQHSKILREKEQDFMSTWWAPVDITCFKGQQWNNVLGMGGSCTSDDQCCSVLRNIRRENRIVLRGVSPGR